MESTGAAGMRNCVSCGRSIAWDANVCPYCGRDYRFQAMAPQQAQVSEGMKILLYIISFLIPLVGFIVGAVYYTKPEREYRELGKMCIILGVVGVLLGMLCWIPFYIL